MGSQPAPGKQDNCQVAVSLSVANEATSLPIDYRLYLPKDRAGDPARRGKAGLLDLALFYVVDVQPNSSVWPDGEGPLPAKPWSGQGRPPTRLQRSNDHQPASAWQEVTWRAGVKGDPASRFAAKRIRPAHRDDERDELWPELWLLVEWPDDEAEPGKFWFANLPADTSLDRPVHLAKLRWRIERDYLDLKQELGLGH